jgi:hypothetical protein
LPTSETFPLEGGDAIVNVTAPAGCGWQAASNDSWITITTGSSGIGNGTVNYSVGVNATGVPRVGTMTIAGLTFTVNQTNVGCTYSILPLSQGFPGEGGDGNIAVTTQNFCRWKALSNDSWIVIVSGDGIGSGTASYTVGANPDAKPRNGSITVAGHTFTVTQAGAPCPVTFEPRGELFTKDADESSFLLTTSPSCEWTVLTDDKWIQITSAESGSGTATVSYSVLENLTGSPRRGTIKVGVKSFVVVQDGGTLADCVYVVSPLLATYNAAGGKGTVLLNTPARCAWETVPSVNWITITSDVVGIGTTSISYDVKPNSGAARVGTVVIGGQTLKVKQKGS